MIKVKHFRQSEGFCGPASLKIVLHYYGKKVSEKQIAKMAGSTVKKGTPPESIVKAAESFGFKAVLRENASLSDIRKYIKKGIPVIVNWFFEDDGHYSVAVGMDDKKIYLSDPFDARIRKISLEMFKRVWFDFSGPFLKNKSDIRLRLMIVVTPK